MVCKAIRKLFAWFPGCSEGHQAYNSDEEWANKSVEDWAREARDASASVFAFSKQNADLVAKNADLEKKNADLVAENADLEAQNADLEAKNLDRLD